MADSPRSSDSATTVTTRRLPLDGDWDLHYYDGERGLRTEALLAERSPRSRFSATVPGEVHLDLMRAGLIDEPALGLNALRARWVENMLWHHRRRFDFPALGADAAEAPVWLRFEQVSGVAEFYLNGRRLGRHANDFTPAVFEVSDLLRTEGNELLVAIESGLYAHADRPARPYHENLSAISTKRMWMRKPQSQFGWDWAPRLINIGLGGSVALEWTGRPTRVEHIVPIAEVDADLRRATLRVRAFVRNAGTAEAAVSLAIRLPRLGLAARAEAAVAPGLHPVEAIVEVEEPRLWWPRGQGEPWLEPLETAVEDGAGPLHAETMEIGFRRVRVDQTPDPDGGRSFVIEINNRPVFCKGGNMVPADLVYCRSDSRRLRTLFERAEAMHFNFLRVWGGGVYESETFYREADRRGFLVWQDFIYACAKYPLDDHGFAVEAVAEARHQIRRLARHPSLVAWCGNNELETAYWNWGWEKWGAQIPDHGFFHITLPRLLAEEDPARFYWPSSPHSPDGRNPGDPGAGDQHPWGIGFVDTDFRGYRRYRDRFPNEGGVLGPPALPTALACLPEDQRHIGSFAWEQHDNSVAFWNEPNPIDAQIEQWTGRPVADMTIEDYVYHGGLAHGEGLREYCLNYRRRMFRTAAAVFWMFNDTWPAVRSWTPVDYFLRRTPAFHYVRRALAPVALAVVEEDGEVRVHGLNDTRDIVRGDLRHGLFDTRGGYPVDRRARVELPPGASTVLARFPAAEWTDDRAQLAFAVLHDADGRVLARARTARPLLKDLRWAAPAVDVTLGGGRAVFRSEVFVWGVCLDLDGERDLADNFFDLYPGQDHAIEWSGPERPDIRFTGNRA